MGVVARRLGFGAVLPDMPGYGLTGVPRGRFTYETWVACARDLAVAERDRSGRPVIALGGSMGGMLAWHAAAAGAPLTGIAATALLDPAGPGGARCGRSHPMERAPRRTVDERLAGAAGSDADPDGAGREHGCDSQ